MQCVGITKGILQSILLFLDLFFAKLVFKHRRIFEKTGFQVHEFLLSTRFAVIVQVL